MTDTFELADNNGVRRFGGTAYAPGATPGDVFTVQADGSLLPAPGGGSGPVQKSATVPVTSAQLKALLGTPITLLAAPGLGKVNLPLAWFVRYVFVTTDYSNWNGSDADPWVTLGNLSQVNLTFGQPGQTAGGFATGAQPPDSVGTLGATFESSYTNAAVLLQNFGGQDLVDGDSTLEVTTFYAELTLS